MRIPIATTPGVARDPGKPSTPNDIATIGLRAASATGGAIGDAGKSLQFAGALNDRETLEEQQRVDSIALMDLDLAKKQATIEMEEWVRDNPDETTWPEKQKEIARKTHSLFDGKVLSREANARIEHGLQGFDLDMERTIGDAKHRKHMADLENRTEAMLDLSMDDPTPERGLAALRALHASRGSDPETLEASLDAYDERWQLNWWDNQSASDPLGTLESIRKGEGPEDPVVAAQVARNASAYHRIAQKDAYDSLVHDLMSITEAPDAPEVETPDGRTVQAARAGRVVKAQEAIQVMLENKTLDPADAQNYIKAMTALIPPDHDYSMEWLRKAEAWRPTGNTERDAVASVEFNRAMMDPLMHPVIRGLVKDALAKSESGRNESIEKLIEHGNQILDDGHKRGDFGHWDKEAASEEPEEAGYPWWGPGRSINWENILPFGDSTLVPGGYSEETLQAKADQDAATTKLNMARRALRDWVEANPNATEQEISQQATILRGKVPTEMMSEALYKASLPPVEGGEEEAAETIENYNPEIPVPEPVSQKNPRSASIQPINSPSSTATTSSASSASTVEVAKEWVGENYKSGEEKRCSDFLCFVFEKAGKKPEGVNYAAKSWNRDEVGPVVTDPRPGDVVIFRDTYNGPNEETHVGLVTERGFVHRPTRNKPVKEDSLDPGSFYGDRILAFRRPNG